MSALTNPVPSPVQPSPAPPPAAPVEAKPPSRGKYLILLAILGIGGWAGYQYWQKRAAEQQAAQTVVFRTAKVVAGPFERTVRLAGQTSARLYANVTAPMVRSYESRSSMVILKLVKNGTWIKKNDMIAEIDVGTLQDHVDDIQSTIIQADADMKTRKAEQAVEIENLQQTLRVAKANLDKAQWDIKAAEVLTDIERELLRLNLEEAEARYKEAQLDVPQKKAGHEAEIKILGYTRERHVRHHDRHESDVKRYTIFSPMEGLVVMQSVFRGGGESYQIQQGDMMGSGQPLAKVVNPRSMQVEANINQAESTDFRIGQEARINLDAFPDLQFKGKVYSIGALAIGGWRQNYYIRNVPVRIEIQGADQRLIPDLSASADIVVDRKDNAVQVPLEAVKAEKDGQFVYVKMGNGFERRAVQLGEANNLVATVRSGVSEGEEVRLN